MTFEEYVAARGPVLLRLAYVLCGDGHLAEDLVQEVLLRVHGRWRRVASLDHPEAYVKRMLVNEYLSWRRRLSNTEVPRQADGPEPEAHMDACEGVVARDAGWSLLATLPRRQRAVLVLRFYEDLSDQQIAEVLGCATATVRSQAARALAALRTSPQLGTLLTVRTPNLAKEA